MSALPEKFNNKAASETALVAIVDTETTGLAEHDEPVSLGIALFEVDLPKGGFIREVDAYYGMREPRVRIDPHAQAVHGLSIDVLRGRSFDDGKVRSLIDRADFVVAHHAEFDHRMLCKIYPTLSGKRWRCSVRQIWWSDFIPVQNEKLDTICAHFAVERPSPHNALDDCRSLADALSRRTGKTERSRTFLGAALAKEDFVFRPFTAPKEQLFAELRASINPKPSQPGLSKRAQWIVSAVVILLLLTYFASKK